MGQFIGPERDIEAVRKIRQDIQNAVNAGDADAFGQHLADDVAQLAEGAVAHGRDEVLDVTRGAYAAYDLEEHFDIDTIVVRGDLAVEHGTYELTMAPKEEGDSQQVSGLPYAYVYERNSDGQWLVLRMSWATG